ncbi:HUS1 checkpoint protein [Cryptococcus deuterogattii 99/473]|uniref:Checkpoint protein n=1 Tax=Cryptococcus deuterogattii Ram5 TaxID=1296110 RepID=A0A0D0V167_9TREE|nr:HUS1 checkpoint protein [Cryptococcus deuterogattii Ram5]KIY55440.1 HUS1 checkpoint protein [Cryptococcus deuterogattii 99/473]
MQFPSEIIRSLAALARSCVIKLSEEQIYFIVPGSESATGVQVWSLHSSKIIELSPTPITKYGSKSISIPWSKFSVAPIILASRKSMVITHEINVKILSSRRQQDLKEPLCPRPDIHVVLPNLQELRNIVSRLAPAADDVEVSANHEGTMELAVRSSKVNLTTTWKELPIPVTNLEEEGEEAEEPPPPGQMMSTTVTIKAFLKFLTSYVISSEAIMCICEGYCVIAYVYIGHTPHAVCVHFNRKRAWKMYHPFSMLPLMPQSSDLDIHI